jgi:hypothetical protein
MSIIHLNQIKAYLKSNFEDLIDMSDYDQKPETEKEKALLSRSLAAFSLVILNNRTHEEASQSVTDGGKDNGIDAIYFDKGIKHLFVIQSKWNADGNGSIDEGATLKFINGFRKLVNCEYFDFNEKLRAKIPEIQIALEDGQTQLSLVIIYSGKDSLAQEPQDDLNKLLKEMNDPSDIVNLVIIKQSEIHNTISQGLNFPINEDIMLYEWGQTKEPYHSFYGQVSTQDIAKWYSLHYARLFSSNIRVFLGNKEVNQGIIDTLKNDPENFWYYNNGITALCSSIKKKPMGGNSRESGTFECKNFRIVNGAQTVGSIYTANQNYPEKLEQARVNIRLISLENCPEEFASNITRYNNTQNKIDSRDFVALDTEQERLKNELQLEEITYVYKSGEVVPDQNKGFDLVDATVVRACENKDIKMLVLAKDKIGQLWDDIEKAPYKTLFNSSVNSLSLWRLVEIMRVVEKKLLVEKNERTGKEKLFATHANKIILHLIYKQLDKEFFDTSKILTQENIKTIEEKLVFFLEAVAREANDLYPDSYPANICRTQSKCKEIIDRISKLLLSEKN